MGRPMKMTDSYFSRFLKLATTGTSRQIVNFFTIALIASKFGLEALAGFSAIQVLLLIFNAIADVGLRNYFCQIFEENSSGLAQKTKQLMIVKILTSSLWLPAYVLIAIFLFEKIDISEFSILISAPCIIFNPLTIDWLTRLQGRFFVSGALATLSAIIFLITAILTPEPLNPTPETSNWLVVFFACSQLVIFIPATVWLFFSGQKCTRTSAHAPPALLKELAKHVSNASPFWLAFLLSRIAPNLSFLLLAASAASPTLIGEFRLLHVAITLTAASSQYLTSPAYNRIALTNSLEVTVDRLSAKKIGIASVMIFATVSLVLPEVVDIYYPNDVFTTSNIALLLAMCLMHLINSSLRDLGILIMDKANFFPGQAIFILGNILFFIFFISTSSTLIQILVMLTLFEFLLIAFYFKNFSLVMERASLVFVIHRGRDK
jgi:O-antigen/teichoic acid export membrane protein